MLCSRSDYFCQMMIQSWLKIRIIICILYYRSRYNGTIVGDYCHFPLSSSLTLLDGPYIMFMYRTKMGKHSLFILSPQLSLIKPLFIARLILDLDSTIMTFGEIFTFQRTDVPRKAQTKTKCPLGRRRGAPASLSTSHKTQATTSHKTPSARHNSIHIKQDAKN